MVDPVTITIVTLGSIMLLTTLGAAIGIAVAPSISSSRDKYVYRDRYQESYEQLLYS